MPKELFVNGPFKLLVPLVAALVLAACNGRFSAVPGTAGESTVPTQNAGRFQPARGAHMRRVCPDDGTGTMKCLALLRTDIEPQMHPAKGSEPGLHPADFQSAYSLPSGSNGSGQIVAIVDAFDNPDVAKDLKTYRAEFGLPAAKFTKYNQKGQTKNYPSRNAYWGVEIDLDVQMVSATCPNCTIYLVEANSGNDLFKAEAEAVRLGAHIISNSWGGTCSGSCGSLDSYFNSTGVLYLAASGDRGYGTIFPSLLGSVVSIGGTTLRADKKTKRGWTESVWGGKNGGQGTGGGCSTASKPSWQHDPGCSGRTANDVSAAGDPYAGGAAEYDTYGYGGWIVVGGTSESSPLSAGIYGLAGNAQTQTAGKKFWVLTRKQRAKDLWVISSGADGPCKPTYLCTAGTHEYKTYSGPAGWGTPNGIGAF